MSILRRASKGMLRSLSISADFSNVDMVKTICSNLINVVFSISRRRGEVRCQRQRYPTQAVPSCKAKPTRVQSHADMAAWLGRTLDASGFAVILLSMLRTSREFGVPLIAVAASFAVTLWVLGGATPPAGSPGARCRPQIWR